MLQFLLFRKNVEYRNTSSSCGLAGQDARDLALNFALAGSWRFIQENKQGVRQQNMVQILDACGSHKEATCQAPNQQKNQCNIVAHAARGHPPDTGINNSSSHPPL